MSNPNLIIVGSVGIDHIETPSADRPNLLGGSASYACAAASFHAPVGMVGVVGSDFPPEHTASFEHFGIDLKGLQVEEGRTFAWHGRYHENMDHRDTLETVLGVFEHFNPTLPESYRDVDYLFLGNIHPGLQLRVLEQVESPKFILIDTMDLWINIARDELTEVFKKVHMLTVNESEAQLYTGKYNLVEAARDLLALGPKYVLIKRGGSGCMLFPQGGGQRCVLPAYPVDHVEDPTGAGDTFAGGLMGALAENDDISDAGLRRALVRGTVVASYGVQSFSLEMLKTLSRADLDARANDLAAMVQLPDVG